MCFRFDYLHKKQTGGAGQYGRIMGKLEPLSGEELNTVEFVDNIVGLSIPKAFIPAIEKGFLEICDKGMYMFQDNLSRCDSAFFFFFFFSLWWLCPLPDACTVRSPGGSQDHWSAYGA